jgi:hypothetical protein
MKKTHDITVITGSYKDRDGNEKKRYTKIGSLFTTDKGRTKIKIDNAHPTMEGGWNGWADVYEIENRAEPKNFDDVPF